MTGMVTIVGAIPIVGAVPVMPIANKLESGCTQVLVRRGVRADGQREGAAQSKYREQSDKKFHGHLHLHQVSEWVYPHIRAPR